MGEKTRFYVPDNVQHHTRHLSIEAIALVEVTKVPTQKGLVHAQPDIENRSVPTAFKKDSPP